MLSITQRKKKRSAAGFAALPTIIIVMGVLSLALGYFNNRLADALRASQTDNRRQEANAIVKYLQEQLDCRNTLAPPSPVGEPQFDRSHICPSGTPRKFWFVGATAAEKDTSGPMYQGRPGTMFAGNWYAWLSCEPGASESEAGSLELRLGRWNSKTGKYYKDPATGIDPSPDQRPNPVTGPGEKSLLCDDYFGGIPPARLFTMDMHAMQKAMFGYTAAGEFRLPQPRCDGRFGLWVDFFCRGPTPWLGGKELCMKEGKLQRTCELAVRDYGALWPDNRPCPTDEDGFIQDRELVHNINWGRITGTSTCNNFCRSQHFSIGKLAGCENKKPSLGLDTIVPDSDVGQQVCLCLK